MLLKTYSDMFTKIKVQRQLSIVFFAAVFIPVTLIGSYLIYNTRSRLLEHYQMLSYSDNLRVKSLFLDLTSNIYNKANSLASDEKLIQLLSAEYEDPSEAVRLLNSYSGFKALISQDASLENISIYTFNSTLPDGKYIHPVTEDLLAEPWFQKASSSISPFWSVETITDHSGRQNRILCQHSRIFLPQIGGYALLNLSVSNNHIMNRIENNNLETIIWLDGGETVYSSSLTDAGSSLRAFAPETGGYYLGQIDLTGQKVIGCISPLFTFHSDDVFYIASLNREGLPYIRKIGRIHLSVLLLLLVLTGGFVYSYSSHFGRRIIDLRRTMHNVSCGNYTIADSFSGTDEISEVFADLNIMIGDIRSKDAEVYESRLRAQEFLNRQQQMEFKMLTSQINPHFLYNTLETIRMRALKAGNREVANAIKLLGISMRYVLENTATSFTTLEKELEYTETYLAIQKLRFHERVNYSIKISPLVHPSDCRILPLLLQPVVENAILHGLSEIEENGRIIIHIDRKQDTLLMQVFNNGRGMTPEEIRSMEQNLYRHPEESSKSIGLFNIYQRIRLCYGTEYGLQFKSRLNMGTLVALILPAQEERETL